MTSVLFNFTNRCNIQCRHCYGSCGPEGETIGELDMIKVIEHLPQNTSFLDFSGGEPLVARERLVQALAYIQKNKKRIIPDANISILSNGFWINKSNGYTILAELFRQGIIGVYISNDKFHKEQNIDGNELRAPAKQLLEKLAEDTGNAYDGIDSVRDRERQCIMKIQINYKFNTAQPFGRGIGLSENEKAPLSYCQIRKREVTITPGGLAYPCCWRVTPSIGSAIESPLENLVNKMKQNEIFRAMIEENNPRGAAKVLGVYNKADEDLYRDNPCVKCEEIFRGLR